MGAEQAYNIFGLVAGAIGLLAAIPMWLFLNALPRRKMTAFDTLLVTTQMNLDDGIEEGLLPDADILRLFHKRLWECVCQV